MTLGRNRKYTLDCNTVMRSTSVWRTIQKMIEVPFTLVVAELLSQLVTFASDGLTDRLVPTAIALLAVVAFKILFLGKMDLAIQRRQTRALHKYRSNFLESFLQNPGYALFQIDPGELNENLNDDMDSVTARYTELYPTIISSALAITVYTVYLGSQSPAVAATLLAISLLQIFPPIIVKKFMQANYNECRQMEEKITNHIIEAIDGFEFIKQYRLHEWWLERLDTYHKQYLKVGHKTDAVTAAQRSMFRTVESFMKFGTYALMGLYAASGTCLISTAIQGIYLSGGFFSYVGELAKSIPEYAISRIAEERLTKWVSPEIPEIGSQDSEEERLPCDHNIAFSAVGYNVLEKNILHDINCKLDSAQNYLVWGENGAGKSTFLHIIADLLRPNCGTVTKATSKDETLRNVIFIPQIVPAFNFSAEDFFDMFGTAKGERMRAISERFGLNAAHLKTPIAHLSGGEQKKVFLSFGFAYDPCWLLLDEPSNSLDAYGMDTLCELVSARTGVIVASHDDQFRALVQHILLFREGTVYES